MHTAVQTRQWTFYRFIKILSINRVKQFYNSIVFHFASRNSSIFFSIAVTSFMYKNYVKLYFPVFYSTEDKWSDVSHIFYTHIDGWWYKLMIINCRLETIMRLGGVRVVDFHLLIILLLYQIKAKFIRSYVIYVDLTQLC